LPPLEPFLVLIASTELVRAGSCCPCTLPRWLTIAGVFACIGQAHAFAATLEYDGACERLVHVRVPMHAIESLHAFALEMRTRSQRLQATCRCDECEAPSPSNSRDSRDALNAYGLYTPSERGEEAADDDDDNDSECYAAASDEYAYGGSGGSSGDDDDGGGGDGYDVPSDESETDEEDIENILNSLRSCEPNIVVRMARSYALEASDDKVASADACADDNDDDDATTAGAEAADDDDDDDATTAGAEAADDDDDEPPSFVEVEARVFAPSPCRTRVPYLLANDGM